MGGCRVGIITLPGNYNYGNRLQCYAMSEAVKRVGSSPMVLMREISFPWYRRLYYALKLKYLSLKDKNFVSDPEKVQTPARALAFERFAARIPIVILPGTGYASANEMRDCFVVGSDQVWNPKLTCHQETWYYASFAQPERRAAVSASLGIDSFASADQAKRVAHGVRNLTRVSVREKRGAELLRECAGIEAEVICDPTLVLTADDWRSVSDGSCTPVEPYVFTYLLGGVGNEASEVLAAVTHHGLIPVVHLTDCQKPGELDAGPAEFIDLIDHAEHVVTDSFHAAVFSSILQTPLTIVHREGGASMFSRLEQLSEMLGIEEKVYGSPTYDLARAGEYDGVPEAIEREREKFMTYLEGCLDG